MVKLKSHFDKSWGDINENLEHQFRMQIYGENCLRKFDILSQTMLIICSQTALLDQMKHFAQGMVALC
jgi:hypothetical protein